MNSFLPTDKNAPPLTTEEQEVAVKTLYSPPKFRQVNRKIMDPVKPGEPRFMLFSFVKSEGATPDKDGFLGVAKIRGAFYSEDDAAKRADELIKDVDSTNSIYTAICGQPFPLVDRGFADELSEVDVSGKTEKIISDNVKAKRKAEEREIRAIEERKAALLEADGSIKESSDPLDAYIQKRIKLAQLRYNIKEHRKLALACEDNEKTVVADLLEHSRSHPEHENTFVARYQETRRKCNIDEKTDFTGFMTYLMDPVVEPVADVLEPVECVNGVCPLPNL